MKFRTSAGPPPHWVAPEGLDRSRPRPVRLTGGGWVLLVLAFVLMLGSLPVGVLIASAAKRDLENQRLLREEGMETAGRITGLGRRRGNNDRRQVSYEFTTDRGRTLAGRRNVSPRIWRNLRVGDTIRVRYAPSVPDIHDPDNWTRRGTPIWLAPLVGAVLVISGWLCTLPVRGQRRLLAEGRVAPAIVKKHKKDQHGHKIFYEFRLLSGAKASGKAGPDKHPAAVGQTITVLYDPEEPARNARYPFSLARLRRSP